MATTKTSRKAEGDASSNGAEAAKAETSNEPKTLEFEGTELKLPARLPFKVLRHLRNQREAAGADIYGILETILGIEQTDRLCDLEIDGEPFDVDRGVDLLEQVMEQYGVTLGESQASKNS